MEVSIREAKNNFSKYANLVHSGQRITVCKNGKAWFDLVPHEEKARSVRPLAKPTVTAHEATAPVDRRDFEGWI